MRLCRCSRAAAVFQVSHTASSSPAVIHVETFFLCCSPHPLPLLLLGAARVSPDAFQFSLFALFFGADTRQESGVDPEGILMGQSRSGKQREVRAAPGDGGGVRQKGEFTGTIRELWRRGREAR